MEHAIMPLSDYTDLCDAVREKTGRTDYIKSSEMGDLIRTIENEAEELPSAEEASF